MAGNDVRSRVQAVETTLDIIEFLHEQGGATIETIAANVGVGTSTVHRHLVTLGERNYVVRIDGRYHLSFKFLTHGGRVRNRVSHDELIVNKLHQIVEETGERVQFIIEEQGQRVYVFTYAGPSAVRTDATIGKRGPLHVSAAGKSILAYLPDERVAEILDGLSTDGPTDNSITDRDRLENELEEIRERGYAFNEEESLRGLHAVGAPVREADGPVRGALSISGPANRLTGEKLREELPELLLGATNELEINITYS
jgi:DNA-binding IclR family transcriptional regulator